MSIMCSIFRHFTGCPFQGTFHNFRNYGPDFHSICAIIALKSTKNVRNYGYQLFGENGTSPSDDRLRYPLPEFSTLPNAKLNFVLTPSDTQHMYTRVSLIFLGVNIAKSDVFGSKLTEIIGIIFFGHKALSN